MHFHRCRVRGSAHLMSPQPTFVAQTCFQTHHSVAAQCEFALLCRSHMPVIVTVALLRSRPLAATYVGNYESRL